MDVTFIVLLTYILVIFIKNNKIRNILIICLLLIIVYLRNGSSLEYLDTWNYKYEYLNNSIESIQKKSKGILFDYFGYSVKIIFGNNYKAYFIIIALLIIYPLLRIIDKNIIKNKNISFIFLYTYLFMYTTNILRQGFAAIFVTYALLIQNNIISLILIILGILSHKSAILIIPVIFLRKKNIKKYWLYLILGICFFITTCYPLNEIVIKNLKYLEIFMGKSYIEGYTNNPFVNLGEYKFYRIYTLYYLIISFFMIKFREKFYEKGLKKEIYNIILISFFGMGMLGSIVISRRIIDYLKIMEIFLWPYILEFFDKKSKIFLYCVFILQILIINLL